MNSDERLAVTNEVVTNQMVFQITMVVGNVVFHSDRKVVIKFILRLVVIFKSIVSSTLVFLERAV